MAYGNISGKISVAARTGGQISGSVRYIPGPPGKSAYESAVDGGFEGTEQEFDEALAKLGSGMVPVDPSLSESGHAADAKVTGDRFKSIESDIAELMYEPITVEKFWHDAGTKELGDSVTDIVLKWKLSKAPVSLSVAGKTLTPLQEGSVVIPGTITATTTWKLLATDEKGTVAKDADGKEPSVTLSFYNGIYYGASKDVNKDALTKVLSNTRKRSFTATAGEGEYVWYVLPARLGDCTFAVNGFKGGFALIATMDVINNTVGKYKESYNFYRSDETGLGTITVEVS